MKLTEGIYLCGSGAYGLTPEGDCHCYVIDGGEELAMIDCGLQNDPQAILAEMEKDGLDLGRLRYLFLTHVHPDMPVAASGFRKTVEFVLWRERKKGKSLNLACRKPLIWKRFQTDLRHIRKFCGLCLTISCMTGKRLLWER